MRILKTLLITYILLLNSDNLTLKNVFKNEINRDHNLCRNLAFRCH